jgi:hypothetical protein
MTSPVVKDIEGAQVPVGQRLNPAELKIILLCCGLRVDESCRIEEEGRPVCNAQADLASGLEMILPGDMKELWVNVPVREKFVQDSPYRLTCTQGAYRICDERHGWNYSVRLAPKPDWYDWCTTGGVPMSQVGMLEGSCLSIGQEGFFRALEYSVQKMRKGTVSGELIAGIEPTEDSQRGIDYLAAVGATPLVSIFRPLQQTEMQDFAPPGAAEMLRVFRHVYQACRAHNLPIGLAPNFHLSVLPLPEDTIYLAADSRDGRTYQNWILSMQEVMRPYFLSRMRKQPVSNP